MFCACFMHFRSMRLVAYRQWTWWIHGKLGKRNRKVIPACVVAAVRKAYPEADPARYRGFEEAGEDEEEVTWPG